MRIEVENIISIFTIIDGKINILIKNNDTLKVKCNDDFDIVNNNYINNKIKNLNLKQCYTFNEKHNDILKISVLFIDIVNYNDIYMNSVELVPISDIKNKNIYIEKSIECLRKELNLFSTIKKLYPNEFVLPEIQRIYEDILNKKFDRRNFRKRLIKLNIIECLDKNSSNKNGRPAKLYRFKNLTEDLILF